MLYSPVQQPLTPINTAPTSQPPETLSPLSPSAERRRSRIIIEEVTVEESSHSDGGNSDTVSPDRVPVTETPINKVSSVEVWDEIISFAVFLCRLA